MYLPISLRRYDGMLHSSDWYRTLVEGVAKGTVPDNTGPVPVDGFDAWDAIVSGTESPRNEVVHQVRCCFFSLLFLPPFDGDHFDAA
jgi:hypothetical protein